MATNQKKRSVSGAGEVSAPTAAVSVNKKKSKTKNKKSSGLTKEDNGRIKSSTVRASLMPICELLARQVDDEWHDGYEKQSETKADWFREIEEHLQAVLDIGVGKEAALVQCNEVLKIVADSLADLLATPCRCDTMDEFSEMDERFTLNLPWGGTHHVESRCPYDAWAYVWIALLRVHATKEDSDEEALLQCLKDASDNIGKAEFNKSLTGHLYDTESEYDEPLVDAEGVPSGAALAKLVKEKATAWQDLETTKKEHTMRRGIDRRFDGDPSRRTRRFSSDEEDEGDEYGQ
jgi:hypothetical protein